jgi:predicted nucleic acid-binding protein
VARTTKLKEYVLDTSVVVKWFSREEKDSEKALLLRDQLLDGFCLITVPTLLIYELANALRYNPSFSATDVNNSLDSIFNMGIKINEVDSLIINDAIRIAAKYNVTVYDAYFMALSKIEDKPLLTADYKFFKTVKGFKNLIKLSEI